MWLRGDEHRAETPRYASIRSKEGREVTLRPGPLEDQEAEGRWRQVEQQVPASSLHAGLLYNSLLEGILPGAERIISPKWPSSRRAIASRTRSKAGSPKLRARAAASPET